MCSQYTEFILWHATNNSVGHAYIPHGTHIRMVCEHSDLWHELTYQKSTHIAIFFFLYTPTDHLTAGMKQDNALCGSTCNSEDSCYTVIIFDLCNTHSSLIPVLKCCQLHTGEMSVHVQYLHATWLCKKLSTRFWNIFQAVTFLYKKCPCKKVKTCKAISVTGCRGLQGCGMSRIPYFLGNQLIDGNDAVINLNKLKEAKLLLDERRI
jgi:hypothetical protein